MYEIQQARNELISFTTWFKLRHGDSYVDKSNYETEEFIKDVWSKFISARIYRPSYYGKAKQAFWANLEFCNEFNEYFWMSVDLFQGNEQYHTWKTYCYEYLGFEQGELEKYVKNKRGRWVYWEKPDNTPLLEFSQKYKTWYDPFNESYEEE